jgi:hypothetical protein
MVLDFTIFGDVWSTTQCVLGVIAVYNLGRALRSPSERKQPFPALSPNDLTCFNSHVTHRLLLRAPVCDPDSYMGART